MKESTVSHIFLAAAFAGAESTHDEPTPSSTKPHFKGTQRNTKKATGGRAFKEPTGIGLLDDFKCSSMAASVQASHRGGRYGRWNLESKLEDAYPKTKHRVEFGDFQTRDALARRVCDVLHHLGVSPGSIVEPTCGQGAFLRASVSAFPKCTRILGFEVNPDYVRAAKKVEHTDVHCEDFFDKDWPGTLDSLREPILVIGNPPWVTNSAVGTLGGTNLPTKSNFRRLNGFDAITGKSNFDISEWMLLHLLEWLSGREAVLAMLCKTVVARKVLHHAWSRNLQVAESAVHLIDAAEHFGASVDACLLVSVLKPEASSRECAVYPDLESSADDHSSFAFRDGRLVANLDLFNTYRHLSGTSTLKWRSGVKHDCSRVMEPATQGMR